MTPINGFAPFDWTRRNVCTLVYWVVFGFGLIWTLQQGLYATGSSTDDEIGHYLFARDSSQFPAHLLNIWGRPFNTLVYALPAQAGLQAARVWSVLISAATVLVTTRLAAFLGIRLLFLIPAFLWFQPWFNGFGYEVITEVPFALLLALGTYLWATERYQAASLAVGLLPLTRHEALALAGLWFLYMVWRREWRAAAMLVLPLCVFNLAYLAVERSPAWMIYFQSRPTDRYGSGDWFHFIRSLRWDVGKPILLLSLLGLLSWHWLRNTGYLFAGYAAYFALHTVLFRFGLFASGGYQEFILPVAPAFAIAAAFGVEYMDRLWQAFARQFGPWKRHSASVVAIGVIVILTISYDLRWRPRLLEPEAVAVLEASNWLKANGLAARPIFSTNVYFYHFHPMTVPPDTCWWTVPDLDRQQPGTIVIWDMIYSEWLGLHRNVLSKPDSRWRQLASFRNGAVVLFEKLRPDPRVQ